MDVDRRPEGGQLKKTKQTIMETDLDLDSVCSIYTGSTLLILGNGRIERLIFIGNCCPPLRIDAYQKAIQYLKETVNVEKYQDIVSKLNQELEAKKETTVDLDLDWISKIAQKNNEDFRRLEMELSSYKSNLIKESIRVEIF